MANTRSDLMALLYTEPQTKADVSRTHGRTRKSLAKVTVAGTESANHYFPLFRLPANARVWNLLVSHTDLGTTLTMDFGITVSGNWSLADQTEKDIDILADGSDMAAAARNRTSIFGSGITAGTHLLGRTLWELAGDSAAPTPGTTYDVVAKIITTGTPAAGTMDVELEYTAGD